MGKHALNNLTATRVAKIKDAGRHADGGGLYLSVDRNGRRRWMFMYVRGGKRTELGLGSGRDLSLANARTEAASLREMLVLGFDPKVERQKVDHIPSFGECADAYIEAMRPSWRSAKHLDQWIMTLTKYAKPIRCKPVDTITTQDVLEVLQARWQRTPETAERLRGRIENVLDAAKAKGFRGGENPARWRGHLDQLLPKRQRITRGHHAALPYEEIASFTEELRQREAVAALALEFLILTAARTGEILGATWDEVNLEKRLWTIPAERMKAAREHRVPLSTRVVEIVSTMQGLGREGYIFPGSKPAHPLSSMAMVMLLRRMKQTVTVHGFRSTFRDWASETTGFSHQVCEMALAHTIANKAEAAYRRGDLLKRRRELMEAWASYCATNEDSKIIPLRQTA